MSNKKDLVAAYFEGFRRTDHAMILACLTDDVVWDLPGYRHLEGKAAFDGEIEGEGFTGSPQLQIDRMIEEGESVVAVGTGQGTLVNGEPFRFAYCDVFTFRGDLIQRVESYLVPLSSDA